MTETSAISEAQYPEQTVGQTDQFGRFRLIKRLDSERGQSRVWLTEDRRLETEAVFKIYTLEPDADVAQRQYQAERQAFGLALPCLPRLRDAYAQTDGSLCLVRDYIPGRCLNEIVKEDGRLSPQPAAELTAAVARLAHSLHTCRSPRVIGDLNPGNFVLDEDGAIWCIDLGSSCPLRKADAQPPSGGLAAPAFAAPEQTSHVSVATDIWGLGALLFYLLTGLIPPSEGGRTACALLRDAVPDISESIADILCRSLQPDEATRFESAKVMAEALAATTIETSTGKRREELLSKIDLPPLAPPVIRPLDLEDSPVAHALRHEEAGSLAWAALSQEAADLRALQTGERLAALDTLDIEPYAHQLETARRVLTCPTMRGGAILADEVGLGKTIEALMILQELRLKGQAESALIIAPPQAVMQWAGEVRTRIRRSAYERGFRLYEKTQDAGYPWLIVSAAMLRTDTHRDALSAHRYDLVVVDEAHTVVARSSSGTNGVPVARPHGPANALGRAVGALRYRRLLLLTATPLRRRWRELFDLVSLIRPGFVGTRDEFEARFDTLSERAPTDQILAERRALRAQLDGVLIRHRRRDLKNLALPTRAYQTIRVAVGHKETEFAAKEREIASYMQSRAEGERAVIFASSPAERASLALHLQTALPERPTFVFEGDRRRRQQIGRAFTEAPGAILVAADTGTEGMNWQCASIVIHADIPWNPCVWEQRIGRVYRLGQRSSQVDIIHVATEGSADEAVLNLYEQALGLFDLAVGEAEAVLDYVPDAEYKAFFEGSSSAPPEARDMQQVLRHCFQKAAPTRGARREPDWAGSAVFSYGEMLRSARRAYDMACAESDILDALLGLEDYI
jgi:superfamily II DNA or RNA helicase